MKRTLGAIAFISIQLLAMDNLAIAQETYSQGKYWRVAAEIKAPAADELLTEFKEGSYVTSYTPVLVLEVRPLDLHSPDLVLPVIDFDGRMLLGYFPSFALLDSAGRKVQIYHAASNPWVDLRLHVGSRGKLMFGFPGPISWNSKEIGGFRMQVSGKVQDVSGNVYDYYVEVPLKTMIAH